MSEGKLCVICSNPTNLLCGRCQEVSYCSKDHQKIHWKMHRNLCREKSFKVVKDDSRFHLVALKSIPEGKIFLKEKPIVIMPLLEGPTCLGCNSEPKHLRYCTSCGLPVCSPPCEESVLHKPECEATVNFRKSKILPLPELSTLSLAILFLRCIYLKVHDEDAWAKFYKLKIRTKQNLLPHSSVVSLLENIFRYKNSTSEELCTILNIFLTNFYTGLKCHTLYENASYIEHNCYPNCGWVIADDLSIVFRAVRDINKGEYISVSHLTSVVELVNKPSALMNKNLVCTCKLCTSPTEPDSLSESVNCPKFCGGYAVPRVSPYLSGYTWECTKCLYKPDTEMKTLSTLELFVGYSAEKNPETMRILTERAEREYLHPSHFAVLQMKWLWLEEYFCVNMENMSDENIRTFFNAWCEINFAPPRFLQHNIHLRLELFRTRVYIWYQLMMRPRMPGAKEMMNTLVKDMRSLGSSLLKYDFLDEEKPFLESLHYSTIIVDFLHPSQNPKPK